MKYGVFIVLILLYSSVFADENNNMGNSKESIESIKSAEIAESIQSAESTTIDLGENIYMESNGGFFGVGLGYGAFAWQMDYNLYNKGATPLQTTDNKNAFGVAYTLMIGYKHFFNQYFGVRAYTSFGANHGVLKRDGFLHIDMVDYGANVDFLANVYANENIIFGLFLGLGFGGNTIVGKYIKDLQRDLDEKIANDANLRDKDINIKTKATHFDFAINAGLRLNIGVYHGIELAVRMPLLTKAIYSYGYNTLTTNNNQLEITHSTSFYNEVKLNHSIMLKYVVNF